MIGPRKSLTRRTFVAAGLAALASSGCKRPSGKGRGPAQHEEKKSAGVGLSKLPELGRPSILLVVLDTLRHDHVSYSGNVPGGYTDLTPHLDELARKGIRYEKAYANAPWTLPSHASLFTGFGPHVHLQGHNAVVRRGEALAVQEKYALPGRFLTMAAVLREIGYQTLGVSQNPWVGPLTTQDYGFDHFYPLWDQASLPFPPRKGEDLELHKVTYACRYYFEKVFKPRKPLFLFINYITCHLPYQPAWKFRRRYVPGFPPDYVLEMTSHNWLLLKQQGKLEGEAVTYLRKLYLAEAAEVDAALGQLLELAVSKLGEDLLIIVTSDHGECIGHHGFFDHQFNLYEDLLRVPLLITHPKLPKGIAVKTPVQLSDIFPTLLGLLGCRERALRLKLPGPALPLRDENKPKDRPLFFLFRRGSRVLEALRPKLKSEIVSALDRDLFGVRFKDKKLIVASDGKGALYDLSADPAELKNRINENRPAAGGLFAMLREVFAPAGLPLPERISEPG